MTNALSAPAKFIGHLEEQQAGHELEQFGSSSVVQFFAPEYDMVKAALYTSQSTPQFSITLREQVFEDLGWAVGTPISVEVHHNDWNVYAELRPSEGAQQRVCHNEGPTLPYQVRRNANALPLAIRSQPQTSCYANIFDEGALRVYLPRAFRLHDEYVADNDNKAWPKNTFDYQQHLVRHLRDSYSGVRQAGGKLLLNDEGDLETVRFETITNHKV